MLRTGLPEFATAEEHRRGAGLGAPITDHLSHKTPYYYDLMDKGLGGIIAGIEARIAEVGARRADPEREEKLAFFEACRVECRAVIAFAHRYAELAERLSAAAGEPRRSELLRIAAVCRRVPENPPRSFAEAVQSFWFLNHAFHVSGTKISCGRLDQHLYPSLQRDLASGAITLEAAQELVDCLWLRFNDRSQIVRENFYTKADSGTLPESLRDAVVVVDKSVTAPTRATARARARRPTPPTRSTTSARTSSSSGSTRRQRRHERAHLPLPERHGKARRDPAGRHAAPAQGLAAGAGRAGCARC